MTAFFHEGYLGIVKWYSYLLAFFRKMNDAKVNTTIPVGAKFPAENMPKLVSLPKTTDKMHAASHSTIKIPNNKFFIFHM